MYKSILIKRKYKANTFHYYLILKSEEKNKFIMTKQFFFEDYSNIESIKNSEAYSEYDNNDYFFGVPNISYSHKAVNNIIGFKFRKSKIFEDDDKKTRESYSATYKA